MKQDQNQNPRRWITLDFNVLNFSTETITLKIEHAIIFEYMAQFALKGNARTKQFYDRTYYWISTSKIIHDLPGLQITTKKYINSKYIKDLCDCGLLSKYIDNKAGNKTYYYITKLAYTKLLKTDEKYKDCDFTWFQPVESNKQGNVNIEFVKEDEQQGTEPQSVGLDEQQGTEPQSVGLDEQQGTTKLKLITLNEHRSTEPQSVGLDEQQGTTELESDYYIEFNSMIRIIHTIRSSNYSSKDIKEIFNNLFDKYEHKGKQKRALRQFQQLNNEEMIVMVKVLHHKKWVERFEDTERKYLQNFDNWIKEKMFEGELQHLNKAIMKDIQKTKKISYNFGDKTINEAFAKLSSLAQNRLQKSTIYIKPKQIIIIPAFKSMILFLKASLSEYQTAFRKSVIIQE